MPHPVADPVLINFQVGMLLLSAAIGLYLIYARFFGPILRYSPRRPVPWGPVVTMLVVLYVVTAFSSALDNPKPPEQNKAQSANAHQEDPKDAWRIVAGNLAIGMASQGFIVVGFVFVIAVFYQATPRDLGLPANSHQFARDVFIGAVAIVAALAPVYLTQSLFLYLMNMHQGQSGNPLMKMMQDGEPSVTVMVLASLAAVVVAPICEETAFRLLLQGWLEKWEDQRLGWRAEPPPEINDGSEVRVPIANPMPNDEARMTNKEIPDSDDSSFVIRHSSFASPPQRGVAGLPYGWLPILVSSVLFGLAHLGNGPDPVPLFFLALFLGYLYHRTHRIVPCIVCHALFNAFAMFALWRMAFHGAH